MVREQKVICRLVNRVERRKLFVKIRKPELYRASRRDSEEWPASPNRDGDEELVGESWFAHHR